MGAIEFLAASLAVWRISKVITEEEGPFSIFIRLRSRYPQNSWFGRGIYCLWCISFWAGVGVGLIVAPSVVWALIYGLAWSAVAIAFDLAVDFARKALFR